MKILSSTVFAVITCASLMSVSQAGPRSIPDCRGPDALRDRLLVTINKTGSASRDDLLGLISVLATGGFQTTVLVPAGVESSYVVGIAFDRSYYGDQAQAEAIFQEGLLKLASLKDIDIACDGVVGPTPGITIRN